MTEFKYRAFISYSWADAKWGQWLQRRLETYRTPAALVGKDGAHGPVSARLHPIFRDREDQSAGASISASLVKGLEESEFLIVVCSPNSAKSSWCEQEIAWFKTNRDPDKILALIVDGEPGDAEHECFPRALTHIVNEDLTVTDKPDEVPLAADARITGDGKRKALLKLVAAMLGIGLDELVNRDERRRTLRTRAVVAASLALAAVMSTLTWFAVEARKEAEFQRNEADGLVEFMLTDLRDKLEPVGRLDALDVVGKRALDYYAKQKLGDLDADALGRRARALLLVGEVSNIRGNSDEALRAFRQAAATTGEQLARDLDNEQRIFDHAQSVFWVGYIAYNRGEQVEAEKQFREYKRLADRLVELNPRKPEWQMESSYAESNLGVMFIEQGRFVDAEPAFERGLKRIEAVARSAPYDAGRQVEIGMNINWLGLVNSKLGREKRSLDFHQREVRLYEDILKRYPSDAAAKNRLVIARHFVGDQQLRLGQTDAAIGSYDLAGTLNSELRRLEPVNTEWQQTEVGGLLDKALILFLIGEPRESEVLLDRASTLLSRLIATDPSNAEWSKRFRRKELMHRAKLALNAGNSLRAKALADEAVRLVQDEAESIDRASALLLSGDIEAQLGNADNAQSKWQTALKILPEFAGADHMRFAVLKRLGQDDLAKKIAATLDRRGFRHPAYLKERQP